MVKAMFSAFINTFKIEELRQRIIFTLALIFVTRIICNVSIPGVDIEALREYIFDLETRQHAGFMGFFNLFTGGALEKCAVGTLGIMPYISASIIMQLLTAIIPSLEKMVREGETGRQKFMQYTRYLTLLICIIQGLMLAIAIENPGTWDGRIIVSNPGWSFRLVTILCVTTGTMLLMWLGEQITDRGIGNGASLIITVSIASRLPSALYVLWTFYFQAGILNFFHVLTLCLMFFAVTAGTVALTQGVRRIPIHTTKRVIGRKVYGGQHTYMPLRVNYTGVMPIIFASVLLNFPAALIKRIPYVGVVGDLILREGFLHMFLYSILILFFSYFWVATQFNPLQIADDLKRNGAYIPGIRPGKPTAEFLDKTMSRVTLIGAVGLVIIAIVPDFLYRGVGISWIVSSFFGGTSLLIIVGVMLDTMRQVESYLLMRYYDGFLNKGRIRGRR